jgi:hypothetical protein
VAVAATGTDALMRDPWRAWGESLRMLYGENVKQGQTPCKSS